MFLGIGLTIFSEDFLSDMSIQTASSISALSALGPGLSSGSLCYVASLKSLFMFDSTSTLTADSITVVTATGGGRFVRVSNAHPFWATVATWYINATSGNDENDGQTSGTALKSWAELARRWGSNQLNIPVNVGTKKVCTVNLLTSLPTTDLIVGSPIIPTNTFLEIKGGVLSVLQTGTFTAITSRTPGTNAPNQYTDLALPAANTWSSFIAGRVRMTSGTASGAMFYVMKDLGSKQARLSECVLPGRFDPAQSTGWPNIVGMVTSTVKTPTVGDAYAVEQLISANIGEFQPTFLDGNGSNSRVHFSELNIANNGSTFDLGRSPWFAQLFVFWACTFTGYLDLPGAGVAYQCCAFTKGAEVTQGNHTFNACLIGTGSSPIGLAAWGGITFVNANTMFQGCGIRGTGVYICQAGIFDSASSSLLPGGHAVAVGAPLNGTLGSPGWMVMEDHNGFTAALWGSGNAGAGTQVEAGSQFNYRSGKLSGITVTGSTPGTNDVTLAGNTQARAWDDTNSVFTAKRTLSYANLAATIATTGFGGNAVDLTSGARFAQAA